MPIAATTPPSLATLVLLTALSILSLNMFVPSLAHMAEAFRVTQGVVITGWAVSLAVIGDTAPPRGAASRIGYLTTAMAIAPMLGPSVGGILDETLGWRANFLALAGAGAVALCLCWVDVGETNRTRSATMSAQFRTYPALLRSRRYWGYALCMAFSTGSFYVFLAAAPYVAITLLGISPPSLGIGMGLMTAGFASGSFLSGRYSARWPLTTTMIAGRLVATTGLLLGLMLFAAGIAHPASLFGPAVLVGVGNGLSMPGSNAGVLSVRRDLAGSASGLAGALTISGGGVLTATAGAVITGQAGALALFGIMLACTLAALAAALDVRGVDRSRREPDLS